MQPVAITPCMLHISKQSNRKTSAGATVCMCMLLLLLLILVFVLYSLHCIVYICDCVHQTIATEEFVPTLAKPVPEQVMLKEGGLYPIC